MKGKYGKIEGKGEEVEANKMIFFSSLFFFSFTSRAVFRFILFIQYPSPHICKLSQDAAVWSCTKEEKGESFRKHIKKIVPFRQVCSTSFAATAASGIEVEYIFFSISAMTASLYYISNGYIAVDMAG